jgi:hypothetical protein
MESLETPNNPILHFLSQMPQGAEGSMCGVMRERGGVRKAELEKKRERECEKGRDTRRLREGKR